MYEASVGLFVPYLRNLSGLLDKGVAYAEARKFNPAVLLGMRMAPEHVRSGAADRRGLPPRHGRARPCWRDREPVALPVLEHDMAGLQARIATSIEFIESLPRAEIDAAAERDVFFRLKNGDRDALHRADAAADLQRAAVLLSRHDGLRHVAARRRRAREEGLSSDRR